MIRTAAASTYTELAQTPNGSSTQPCSEVQERYVVAVFLSSSAVRVLSLSSFLVSRTLSGSLFASPSSLCFLYVRLILNCERIAIKYVALLYIIPSISYQVPGTRYHTAAVSYIVGRASQMLDCCIIPVLSLFVCDSSCSNAFPFVLCRYHCRYHRCKDVGRVATVHIPSMPVRLYRCQYVGRVTRYCCTYIYRPSQHVRMIS